MNQFDIDYNQEIGYKWWMLMSRANEKGLTIFLHKGQSPNNVMNLSVKIKTNYERPRCLFSEIDLDHSEELFYKAKRFVDNFKKDER